MKFENCHYTTKMELMLLEDVTVRFARIVNLAANDEEASLAVAVGLEERGSGKQWKSIAVQRLRKSLSKRWHGAGETEPVPKKWIVLDDVSALEAEPEDSNAKLRLMLGAVVSPKTISREDILKSIVAKVLRVPVAELSPTVSFIRLGGDSITAIAVVSQCMAAGIKLQVRDLMRCESLLEVMSAMKRSDDQSQVPRDILENGTQVDPQVTKHKLLSYWCNSEQWPAFENRLSQQLYITPEITEALLKNETSDLRASTAEICLAAAHIAFQNTYTDRELTAAISTSHTIRSAPASFPSTKVTGLPNAIRQTRDLFAGLWDLKEEQKELPCELVVELGDKKDQKPNGMKDAKTKYDSLFILNICFPQNGPATLEITYPQDLKHPGRLSEWMAKFQEILQTEFPSLHQSAPFYSLRDFQNLPLSYSELEDFLPIVKSIGINTLADAFPTSPVQDGILTTQSHSPHLYRIDSIVEFNNSRPSESLNLELFEYAWRDVVARHTALRTIFIPSVRRDAVFDQLVLKHITPKIKRLGHFGTTAEAVTMLSACDEAGFDATEPAHHLTICTTTSGHIYCRLEISHAIVDGMSGPIIFKDMCDSYEGRLEKAYKTSFGEYIAYHKTQDKKATLKYWSDHLEAVEPCQFPTLQVERNSSSDLKSVPVELGSLNLNNFCKSYGVTAATLFQTVWAIILRAYTSSDDVCFGYLSSGRDVPVDGIEKMVGPLINLLVCRLRFIKSSKVGEILNNVQQHLNSSMDNQYISLAEIQHAVAPGKRQIFNTLMSIMYSTWGQVKDDGHVSVKPVRNLAPTEVTCPSFIR
jgi:aryl carrier-like protein